MKTKNDLMNMSDTELYKLSRMTETKLLGIITREALVWLELWVAHTQGLRWKYAV